MNELATKQCIPCAGGIDPLAGDELGALLDELGGGWEIVDGHHLVKTFKFANFVDALAWVNELGALAEQQNHHPDVHLAWGRVTVEVWTHKIDGLHESDFVFAAKTEKLDSSKLSR